MSRRPIRITFTDFPGDGKPHAIIDLLSSRFELQITDERPDYVIYSVFGNRFLNYSDAVRIFITSENVRPDFNLCDYAFGFDWLEFGDRYYRAPNYAFFPHFKQLCQTRRSHVTRDELSSTRTRFCNFIYTNGQAHPYRDQLFHALSRYKPVDSAGRHLNNTGFNPGKPHAWGWADEKVRFQSQYKFTIACENDTFPGYTTEKIVHALAAGTIPIYFGDPLIAREFNRRRIVNCHEFDSIDAVVRRVAELDRNDDLYLQVVAEPYFPGDQVPIDLTDDALLAKFDYIFSQPKENAKRRGQYYWSRIYEMRRQHQSAAAAMVADVIPLLLAAKVIAAEPTAQQIESTLQRLIALPPPEGDASALTWKINIAVAELDAIVPQGHRVILVDQSEWVLPAGVAHFKTLPFLERDGDYCGPPTDDATAIAELTRMRKAGATFIGFGWPSFWWLEHYVEFASHLRENFPCVLKNERIQVFNLSTPLRGGSC